MGADTSGGLMQFFGSPYFAVALTLAMAALVPVYLQRWPWMTTALLLLSAWAIIFFALRSLPTPNLIGYMAIIGAFGVMGWYETLPKNIGVPKQHPPSVVLLAESGRLLLHNHEPDEIAIWGTQLTPDRPPLMEREPRIVPVGHHYYFLAEDNFKKMMRDAGQTDALLPFEVYLEKTDKTKWTARFKLRIALHGDVLDIHTQQLGVSSGEW